MTGKKFLYLLLALVMVCSLLVGCAPADDAKDNDKKGDRKDDKKDEVVEVVFANSEQVTTLDDYNIFSIQNKKITPLWADRLLESDHAQSYTPGVLTEWTWSDDGLTCTMKVREGITFSNGEKLTAYDVKVSMERLILKDKYPVGVATDKWRFLESVETDGDYTAIAHFTQPMPTFEAEAACLFVICASEYEKDPENFFNKPIGSGPYTVESVDYINSEFAFEKREDWWGYEAFGKEPSNVDKITYKYIVEATTRVSSLRTGEIDIAESVPMDNVSVLEDEGLNVVNTDRYYINFLRLNCREGEWFSDPNLREALSLCINRQLLCDNIVGGGTALSWPVPEGCSGYQESEPFEYNVEKAKKLVEESDYDGSPIVIKMRSGAALKGEEVFQAIIAMAAEAGFNFTLEMIEGAVFNELMKTGDYDIAQGNSNIVMGESYMQFVEFYGQLDKQATGYVNEEVWNVVKSGESEIDFEKRQEIMRQAYQMVKDNYAPFILLYNEPYAIGVNPDITGYTLYHDSIIDLRFLQVG